MVPCINLDLFLVRHGVTDWNKEKRYLGHTDRGVLKSELIQLENLKKTLRNYSFDQVYSSDLRRCQETVAYLNLSGQMTHDARVREMNFGDWEGKTYNELQADSTYRDWLDNWEDHPIPNGECGAAFKARIDSFVQDLLEHANNESIKEQKKFLIMTHGGVIRYLVSKFVPSTSFWELSISHGHCITLSFVNHKGEWLCNSLSEVPFQEKES